MTPERSKERTLGWIFAGAAAFHLLLLRPQELVMISALGVLLVGAILRGNGVFIPRWAGWLALFTGFFLVFFSPGLHWKNWASVTGELGAMVLATLLLRPITIGRGQWMIFALLVQLAALLFVKIPSVGVIFIIADVAVCLILMEQLCRPVEAVVNFWVSLLRSLRTIVPVSVIVTGAFWLFPNLSNPRSVTYTGFSGQSLLDPGSIMEVAQSHRLAFTARFAPDQPPPPPEALYWRGQVLEVNGGLRWQRLNSKLSARPDFLLAAPPKGEVEAIRYSQSMAETRGGVVPVLDHALFVEAWREGDAIAVLDIGGGTLSAVGDGSLYLDAVSSPARPRDPPIARLDKGALAVPKEIREEPAIQKIVAEIFTGRAGVEAKLQGIAAYLRKNGFAYSSRPGRIGSLKELLLDRRRGFCEHYAAASANLLRLAGVPARVVAGYRGGRWNPWTHTITVRDAQAHAWVEAWDEAAGEWWRFDPTSFVAPEIDRRIFREMDFESWSWYRQALTMGEAAVANTSEWLSRTWRRLVSPESWERFNQILMMFLLTAAVGWLVWSNWRRGRVRPLDAAVRCLTTLERRAARLARERLPGETPLAWLDRLAGRAGETAEQANLWQFARQYERLVYGSSGASREAVAELRMLMKRILRDWQGPGSKRRTAPRAVPAFNE